MRARIYSLLAIARPLFIGEIAHVFALPLCVVRDHLRSLVAEGLVSRTNIGQWGMR